MFYRGRSAVGMTWFAYMCLRDADRVSLFFKKNIKIKYDCILIIQDKSVYLQYKNKESETHL